ncbi:MAG TPA: hypothetical protein VGM13_07910 [Thermoanaerobaculia bacterium]|jgi:hypothetical protein
MHWLIEFAMDFFVGSSCSNEEINAGPIGINAGPIGINAGPIG